MATAGQIAYAAWHGMTPEHAAEEWPGNDRMVKKWEAVGAAVAAAERKGCCAAIDAIDDGEAPEYRACQEAIMMRSNVELNGERSESARTQGYASADDKGKR